MFDNSAKDCFILVWSTVIWRGILDYGYTVETMASTMFLLVLQFHTFFNNDIIWYKTQRDISPRRKRFENIVGHEFSTCPADLGIRRIILLEVCAHPEQRTHLRNLILILLHIPQDVDLIEY